MTTKTKRAKRGTKPRTHETTERVHETTPEPEHDHEKILIAIQACHRVPAPQQAQRETWVAQAADDYPDVDIRFFKGQWVSPQRVPYNRPTGRLDQDRPQDPPERLPDEVWLDVGDAKEQLSEKVVALCRWASLHDYDRVFKVDIDTYVHVERLLDAFDEIEAPDYVGARSANNRLVYAQGGGGMWLSRVALAKFLDADQAAIALTEPEDIRMGFLLAAAGIELVEEPRFEPYKGIMRAPAEGNDVITAHKCSADDMRAIHARFF